MPALIPAIPPKTTTSDFFILCFLLCLSVMILLLVGTISMEVYEEMGHPLAEVRYRWALQIAFWLQSLSMSLSLS